MTNFLDLKLKDYDEITVNNAVNHLATMLLCYGKAFDYDTPSYIDARAIALGILMEAKELCEDEGCPRAGTVHVCIPKGEPVVDRDEAGNPIPTDPGPYVQRFERRRRTCPGCGRVKFGDEPCATVGCLENLVHRAAPIAAEVIVEKINGPGVPIRCVLCKQAPCQCPPYAPWVDSEPGEHSEVLAAIEAHNSGEEE